MMDTHSPRFPDVDLPHLAAIEIPPLARVRLRQPDIPALADAIEHLNHALAQNAALFDLPTGSAIAVARQPGHCAD